MKTYCENPNCETPAVEEVPVSVHRPSDQKRSLCATCFEAYTWGVQHGGKSEEINLSRVERFLWKSGFLLVGKNHQDPHPGLPFEAWAYRGPLDFNEAAPVTFGLGKDISECLRALNRQLKQRKNIGGQPSTIPGLFIPFPPKETGALPLWRVVYTIDVPAPDVRQAATAIHRIMADPKSIPPVLDILDIGGNVIRVDLTPPETNPGKESDCHV